MSKAEKPKYTKVIARCALLPSGEKRMLLTPYGETVYGNRPSVATFTEYLKAQIAESQVEILAKGLPMEATDDGFLEFYREAEGDIDLAIDSYCSTFKIDRDGKPLKVKEQEPK